MLSDYNFSVFFAPLAHLEPHFTSKRSCITNQKAFAIKYYITVLQQARKLFVAHGAIPEPRSHFSRVFGFATITYERNVGQLTF